ncbi:glycosyltransferase family 4 protein [Vibrio cholerae]
MISTNKTIWYISKYANISKYGADTRQAYFSKEFSKKGYNATLFISNSSHLYSTLPRFSGLFKEECVDGVNIVWINTLKYKDPSSASRMLSWIHFEILVIFYAIKNKKQKPDVVIASSLSLLSVISGLFCKKVFGSKFIFEVRDIWPQSLAELKGLSNSNPIIKVLSWIEYFGYKYSDIIVGTMAKLEDHIRKIVDIEKKVVHIPHGISLEFYKDEQVDIASEFVSKYFSIDKPNFVYAGSFNKAYKLSRLIELAKESRSNGVDAHYVFIGDGPDADFLKRVSANLCNVSIVPRVNRKELSSILSFADVLLHSFDDKPIFMYGVSPNKFIDYMYAGKPIICIGNVYCPLLEESGSGVVIEPENAQLFYSNASRFISLSADQKRELLIRSRDYIFDELNYGKLSEKYCELF